MKEKIQIKGNDFTKRNKDKDGCFLVSINFPPQNKKTNHRPCPRWPPCGGVDILDNTPHYFANRREMEAITTRKVVSLTTTSDLREHSEYKKKQTIHNTESVTSKNEISHRNTEYNLGDKAETSIINEVESSSGTAEITNN